MASHKNARLTARSRELLARKVVEQGVTRYREQGVAGLADRSSRPNRLYRPTSSDRIERVETLRRQRWTATASPEPRA